MKFCSTVSKHKACNVNLPQSTDRSLLINVESKNSSLAISLNVAAEIIGDTQAA